MKLPALLVVAMVLFSCGDAIDKSDSKKKDSDSAVATLDSTRRHEEPPRPYFFDVPRGWTTELIPFPIDFAPGIPYKGIEDLRFPLGWGTPGNDEHWSYMFLWWLDGEQELDEDKLEKYFTEYYSGLVGRNISERKIPNQKVVPTEVNITKTPASEGDRQSYSGKINMLNYMVPEPITLNVKVHIRDCKEAGHTAVFTELSPQPENHRIWKQFEELISKFSCSSK